MTIMTRAKFHFNQLMVTLIFGICFCEPGPGERLKTPGLTGLKEILKELSMSSEKVYGRKNCLN